MPANRGIPDREMPGTTSEGKKATYIDPDEPYTGPGRGSLRVTAHNALPQKERRRLTRAGEMEGYLDEMADGVASQADNYIGQGYRPERAWSLAIRLVIHGREPD